ncbi:MAG: GNAT family N-acetyltransferase [Lachnospiraceae bacterium]|nr:GNAT family N-acetyltransferase [Lachnospiraceae bacterium]
MEGLEIFLLDKATIQVFYELLDQPSLAGFSEKNIALGAVLGEGEDAVPAAVLIATPKEGEVRVDWIYVREECRGKGIGKTLLKKLLVAAYEIPDIDGIWVDYTYEDEGMEDFLRHCGFFTWEPDGAACFRAALSSFTTVGEPEECDRVKPLTTLSDVQMADLYRGIRKRAEKGEDIPTGVPLPIQPEDYLQESAAYVGKMGIEALILLQGVGDGINVAWLYSNDTKPVALVRLFRHVRYSLKQRFSDDTPLELSSLRGKSLMLIRKLLPGAKEIPLMVGYFPL